ncbi:glycosyltransferase family 39 protein [Ascoidea rubescens DSM 1968]|uniref:dolichyl-phosphate-mannose--protein mannosyltransferase n=1 Tax=Ascoidea rubescens DSM 1968 TaxID=1344418 RepID=A0A1D2VJ39_9ASCO|nr:glycosyltransferase family 39 protein [Ascoidea rubescens DSM 1968]ODV61639.1 glycosyltransferase family 39 protein [Ascoidea rubescens DSM 1968]
MSEAEVYAQGPYKPYFITRSIRALPIYYSFNSTTAKSALQPSDDSIDETNASLNNTVRSNVGVNDNANSDAMIGKQNKSNRKSNTKTNRNNSILLFFLILLSIFSSLLNIDYPLSPVTIDETLIVKNIENYSNKTFFLSFNPPLTDLFYFKVNQFITNSTNQQDLISLYHLRIINLVMSSLSIIVFYKILNSLNCFNKVSFLTSLLLIIDPFNLIQVSKYINYNSLHLFLLLLCLYHFNLNNLLRFSISLGLLLSTKVSSVLSLFYFVLLTLYKNWYTYQDLSLSESRKLHKSTKSIKKHTSIKLNKSVKTTKLNKSTKLNQLNQKFKKQFVLKNIIYQVFVILFLIPFLVYLIIFNYHVNLLKHYNPSSNDFSFLSTFYKSQLSIFNNTNDSSSSTTNNIDANLNILYGSKVSIRQYLPDHFNFFGVFGGGNYLYSFNKTYSIGSNEQQVNLYNFNDTNNYWIIEKNLKLYDDHLFYNQLAFVNDNSIIRLRHNNTKNYLHVNNIRGPVSSQDYHFEISCKGDFGKSFLPDNYDNWRIISNHEESINHLKNLENLDEKLLFNAKIKSYGSIFKLYNRELQCYLLSHPVYLPEWGNHQQEVVCVKDPNSIYTNFYFEENSHPLFLEHNLNNFALKHNKKEKHNKRDKEIGDKIELLKKNRLRFKKMTCLEKIIELNLKLINMNLNNQLIVLSKIKTDHLRFLIEPKYWSFYFNTLLNNNFQDNIVFKDDSLKTKILLFTNPLNSFLCLITLIISFLYFNVKILKFLFNFHRDFLEFNKININDYDYENRGYDDGDNENYSEKCTNNLDNVNVVNSNDKKIEDYLIYKQLKEKTEKERNKTDKLNLQKYNYSLDTLQILFDENFIKIFIGYLIHYFPYILLSKISQLISFNNYVNNHNFLISNYLGSYYFNLLLVGLFIQLIYNKLALKAMRYRFRFNNDNFEKIKKVTTRVDILFFSLIVIGVVSFYKYKEIIYGLPWNYKDCVGCQLANWNLGCEFYRNK